MDSFGKLSSLGIGSGVLTSTLINKLKTFDEKEMLDPIKTKTNFVLKQQIALKEFESNFNKLSSEISNFSSGLVTSKINTNTSGNSVIASASKGVLPQNFDIDVKQLAKNDIYQTNGFSSADDSISNNNTKIEIGVGNQLTTIEINKGTTLEELKDTINNKNIGITATILNTGTTNNPYRLILKGNETGKTNIIKFNYGGLNNLGLNQTVYQSASYNSDTDKVNNSGNTQTFKITINGKNFSMNVSNGTEVKDFVNDINNGNLKDSNGNSLEGITAKYENGHIKIHLQQIGNISINDNNLTTNINNNTNFQNSNELQKSENSLFNYNGVAITRTTNNIKDLVPGVNLKLTNLGKTNININYDVNNLSKKLSLFAVDYNKIIDNLQNLTSYNNKTEGLFNNNETFKNIQNELYNGLFSNISAIKLGFSYDKTGHIQFNQSEFIKNFNNNNSQTNTDINLVFNKLNSTVNNIKSNLKLNETNLNNKEKMLKKREEAINELLDQKYNIMSAQFSQYNEIINNFNTQSTVIKNLIAAQLKNS